MLGAIVGAGMSLSRVKSFASHCRDRISAIPTSKIRPGNVWQACEDMMKRGTYPSLDSSLFFESICSRPGNGRGSAMVYWLLSRGQKLNVNVQRLLLACDSFLSLETVPRGAWTQGVVPVRLSCLPLRMALALRSSARRRASQGFS